MKHPGVDKDLQMMRHRRLPQSDWCGEITRTRLTAFIRGHQRHQPQPGRISNCFEDASPFPGLVECQRLHSQCGGAGGSVRRREGLFSDHISIMPIY